jgi:hypothetical protein
MQSLLTKCKTGCQAGRNFENEENVEFVHHDQELIAWSTREVQGQ